MPERVLSLPLNGAEVIEAILDKIRDRLQRDCYLSPNLAYDHFSAVVSIQVKCHDVGRVDSVDVTEKVSAGEVNPDVHLDESDETFEIGPQPPNDVRVETGQGVPVLGKDDKGRPDIKRVKYARRATQKTA